MNKVYKIVWNATLNSWVVVSELGKSKKKSARTALVATSVALLTFSSSINAEVNTGGGTGSGTAISGTTANCGTQANSGSNTNNIAIGCASTTAGSIRSVAIGDNSSTASSGNGQSVAIGSVAVARGDQSVALGNNVNANGNSSIAIGGDDIDKVRSSSNGTYKTITGIDLPSGYVETTATGGGAVVVGVAAKAVGAFSSAFGMAATATGDASVALGTTASAGGQGALAIGAVSSASNSGSVAIGINSLSSGVNSTAIGSGSSSGAGAEATGAGATAIGANTSAAANATALGINSTASQAGGVAIGSDSNASTASGVAGYDPITGTGSTTNTGVWKSTNAAVAVGNGSTVTRQISGLAAGTADTDAVNIAQLKLTKTYTDNVAKSTASALGGGSALNTSNGTVSAPTYTISRVDGTTTTANNVGTALSALSTDIVKPITFAADTGTNVARKLGQTISIKGGVTDSSKLTSNNIGVVSNGSDGLTVQLAKAVDLGSDGSVKAGNSTLNNTGLTISGGPSVTTTGVNAANMKVTNVADGTISATSKDAINGSQLNTVATNLTNSGFNITANGANSDNVKLGETVNFTNTDGNLVASNSDNQVVYNLANKVTVGSGTGSKPVVIDGTAGTVTGLTNTTWNGTATTGRAATEDQLKTASDNVSNSLTNAGLSFAADSGNNVARKLGQTISIKGGVTDSSKLTSNNIGVVSNGSDGLTVQLAKAVDLGSDGSVKAGNSTLNNTGLTISGGPSVTTTGVNAADMKVTNVADGTISATSKDAINGSQLNTVATNLTNSGFNITANGANSDNVKLGETVNFTNTDGNLVASNSDNQVVYNLANKVTVGSGTGSKPVVIDGTAGTVTGLTNTTWNGTATTGRAATEDQLKTASDNVSNSLTNAGLSFAADSGNNVARKLGETLSIKGGVTDSSKLTSNNIGVVSNGSDGLTVQLAKAVDLGSDGSVKAGNSTLNNTGLTISGGPSVTTTGVNAADMKVTNVADGTISATSKDAINGSQLNTVATNLTNSGFNITANGANSDNVKLGETVNFTNTDGNLVASNSNNQVVYNLSKNITVDTIKAGNTEINTSGITVTDPLTNTTNLLSGGLSSKDSSGNQITVTSAGVNFHDPNGAIEGPSISRTGIDAGNKQVTNIAGGSITATSQDAVNGSQLYTTNQNVAAAQATADKGFNITANGANSDNVKLGETVNFTNTDGNLVASNSDNQVVYNLANKVTVGSGTGSKPVVIDGTAGTVTGLTNTTWDGTATTGRAATEDQLKTASDNVSNSLTNAGLSFAADSGNNVARKLGETLSIKGGVTDSSKLTSNNIGVVSNGSDGLTVQLAKAVDLGSDGSVKAGNSTLNNTGLTISGGPSVTTTGVNAADMKVTNVADGTISATSKDAINGSQLNTVATNLTNSGFNITANGANSDNVKLGETVNFTNTDGNLVASNSDNQVVYNLAKNINLNSVTTGNTVLNTNGMTVKDAAGNTAVYGPVRTTITDTNGNKSISNATGTTFSDGLSATQITLDGLTVSGGPSVTTTGVNAADMKVTNVADGTISATSKDAINGSQLNTVATNLTNSGFNITANGANSDNVKLGETVNFTNTDGNLVASNSDNQVVYNLANKVTVGSGTGSKPVVIDGTAGTVTGLTNTTWNGTATTGRAATEDQLKTASDNVSNSLTNAGLNFAADSGNNVARKLGETLSIKGGVTDSSKLTSNNIGVVSNGTDGLTVQLAKAVDLGSDGSVKAGNSTINNDGLTISGGPSVTKDGVNAAGTTISNVKDGVNASDATTKGQLDAVSNSLTNAGLNFAANSGDTVSKKLGETLTIKGTGSKADSEYSTANVKTSTDSAGNLLVGIDKNASFDSVTAGNTVLNNAGVTTTDAAGNVASLTGSGTSITSKDGNTTANYGLDGTNLKDSAGNTTNTTAAGNTIKDSAGNSTNTTAAGNTVKDSAGNSTNTTVAGNTVTAVDSNGNTTAQTNYGANGFSIKDGPSVTKDGVNAAGTTISNVKDGVNASDATTKGQLDAVSNSLTNAGLNFAANSGDTVSKKLGETLTIKGTGSKADSEYSTANVKTSTDSAGNLLVGIDKNASFDSVTAGNTVLNNAGVTTTDAAGNVASLTGSGTSITSKDGNTTANYGLDGTNLKDSAGNTTNTTAAGNTIKDSAGNSTNTTAAGNTVKDSAGNSTNTTAAGNTVTAVDSNGNTTAQTNYGANGFSIKDGPSVTKDGVNAAGTTISNVKDGVNASDATTKGQLDAVSNSLTNAGLNFAANSGDTVSKKLGETLTIKGTGSKADSEYSTANVKTSTDSAGNLLVGIDKNASFDSVTAGNTVLNNAGVTTTDAAGNVASLTGSGTSITSKDGNTTANYGLDGTNLKDSAGNTTNTTAAGNTIKDSAGNSTNTTAAGNTVKDSAGNSTNTTAAGNTVTAVDSNGNTTAQTNYGANGFSIKDGPSVTKDGVNAAGTTISNVKDGVNASDATTKGQLDAVSNSLTNAGLNFAANSGDTVSKKLGETLTIKGTGSKADSEYSTANVKTSTDSAGNLLVGIDKNASFDSVTAGNTVLNNAGVTTTDAAGNVASLTGSGTSITSKDGNTTANYGLDGTNLKDSAGNTTNTTAAGNTIKDSAGNSTNTTAAGNTVKDSAGNSTNTTAAGNTVTAVDSNGNTTAQTNYGANGFSIKDGPSVTKDGVNAAGTTISNVKDGVNASDATTKGQLDAVSNSLTNAGLNFAANSGDTVSKKLGETLTIKGTGSKADSEYSTANVKTSTDSAGNLLVGIDKNASFDSVTAGNTVLNNAGVTTTDAAGNVASLTGSGTSITSKDGNTTANYGLDGTNLKDSAGNTTNTTAAGNTIKDSAGNSTNTTAAGNTVTAVDSNGNTTAQTNYGANGFSIKDGPSVTKDGVNAAGTTISNVKDGVNASDATTKGQLDAVSNSLTNAGLNFAANSGDTVSKKLGETLTIKGTGSKADSEYSTANVKTSTDSAGNLLVGIDKNASFDSVTAGNTVLNNAGVTTTDAAGNVASLTGSGTSITSKDGNTTANYGLDGTNLKDSAGNTTNTTAAGNTIKDSAGNSTNTTAAGNTVKDSAGNSTNTTAAGNTVTAVDSNGNTTAQTNYGANGFSIKDGPSVTKDGVNAAGTTISNVKDGVNASDATTKGQLDAVSNSLTNAGLNFAANSGDTVSKKLGETLTIKGTGSKADSEYSTANVKTSTDSAGNLLVGIDKNASFDSVTAGNTVLNNAGVTTTDAAGNVASLTGSGTSITSKDGNTTANYGLDGTNLKDSAGNTTNTTAAGNTIKDSAGNSTNTTAAGNTVKDSAGNSTNTTAAGNTVTAVDSNGNTTAQTNYGANGFSIKDGPSVTKDGVNAAGTTISNVKDGVNASDATTKGQLDAVSNSLTNAGLNFAANSGDTVSKKLGETLTIKGTGSKADSEYSTANVKTSTDSAGNLLVGIDKNASFDSVTAGNTVLNNAGVTTTDAAGNVASLTGSGTSITSKDGNTTANYGLDGTNLKDSAGNTTNTTAAGNTVKDSAGNTTNTTAAGNTVKDSAGNSTNTTAAGNTVTAVDSNGNTTAQTNYGANGFSIKDGPSVTKDGVNAAGTTISNVKDGVNASDATTKGQLDAVSNSLTNAGLNFAANSGDTVSKKLGETLTIKGTGSKADSEYSTANVKTSTDSAGNLLVGIDKNASFDSVTAGNTVLNNAGVTTTDAAGNVASLTGSGTSITSKDGNTTANYGLDGTNLKDSAGNTTNTTAAGNTIKDSAGNSTNTTAAGNTVKDSAGNSTNTTAAGNAVTAVDSNGNTTAQTNYGANGFSIKDGPSVTKDGVNAAGTTISNVKDGVNASDATTKGQLDAVSNSLTNAGLNFAANSGDMVSKKLGETLTIKGTGSKADSEYSTANVKTSTDSAGNLLVGIDKNASFDSVTAGNTSIGNTGLTILNGPSITTSGINAAGTKVTNVADATDAQDAVNKSQLDAVIKNNITNVTDGAGNSVNIADQVVNHSVNNSNTESLFLTYDKNGQETTDRLSIAQTVQKMNTEGVKYSHTNGDSTKGSLGSTDDSSAGGVASTAMGVNAIVADGANSTIALGHNTLANSTATNSVVIGNGSNVSGASSVAIGDGATASGTQSISIGTGNNVSGNNSGAFGDPSTVSGNESYVLGNNNTVSTDNTFVVGNNVTKTTAGSVVLGTGSAARTAEKVAGFVPAKASTADASAIAATTSTTGAVAVGDAENNVYRQITGVAAGTANSDAVNVAQLKTVDNKVDAGTASVANILGAGATVNGDGSISNPTYNVGGTTSNTLAGALGALDTAVQNAGGSAVKAKTSVSAGQNVTIDPTTNSDGSTNYQVSTAKDLVADSLTAGNTVVNNSGVQVGSNVSLTSNGLTIVNGPSVTTSGINAAGTQITGVAAGTASTDAVNKGQLDTAISGVASNVSNLTSNAVQYDKNADGSVNKDKITLGGGSNGTTITNVANGTVATGSKDAVNGGQLAGVSNSVANVVGGNATVNADGTVSTSNIGGTGKNTINDAIASVNSAATQAKSTVSSGNNVVVTSSKNTDGSTNYQVATADNLNVSSVKTDQLNVGSVSVGNTGINAGSQKVTNVASGTVAASSTDAVNAGQLYTANSNLASYLGGGSTVDSNGQVTAPSYSVAGSAYNNLGDALTAVDNRVGNVENNLNQAFTYTNNRINKLEDKLSAGIAASAALEQAPFVPGKWTYAAGASYYNNQGAVGATLRRTADNGRWSMTGGVAGGNTGSPLFRVGISGVID